MAKNERELKNNNKKATKVETYYLLYNNDIMKQIQGYLNRNEFHGELNRQRGKRIQQGDEETRP